MSINPLDQEISAFFEAESLLDAGDGSLEVTTQEPLRKYIDPARLQARLDRMQELVFEPAYLQYLEQTKYFGKPLLDFLPIPLPPVKVLSKNDMIRVKVAGSKSHLALWKFHIVSMIHELYATGVVSELDLDISVVTMEAARRLQVKGDLIRNSRLRFVEAGSAYRPNYMWYASIIPALLGDMPDLLMGTTNVLTAFTFGIAPITLDPKWSKGLTDFDIVGSIPSASVELVWERLPEEGTLLITGNNAYEMAHMYSHFGDRVAFEWGADLTADMGPIGGQLALSFEEE